MTISQRIRSWLQEGEDILTSLLGLIISISGLIAFGDVLSNGKAMNALPWLLWIWIILQAIAIDYVFYITVKRQFRGASVDRFVYWTRWALITVLGALVVLVGAIFAVHETQGGAVASSMTILGIPSIGFMYVRAAAPVLLLFVIAADHALERTEKPVEAPTTVGMDDETVQLILAKLAKLDALEQAFKTQVVVSEQQGDQGLLPSPEGDQGRSASDQRANIAPGADGTISPERATNTFDRVRAYLQQYPNATTRDIAEALGMSSSTASKWASRVRSGDQANN